MVSRVTAPPRGFTLLELMFAVAIMTVVMGVLFSLSLGIGNTASVQDVKMNSNDEARRAMLAVAPRLRQAARETVNFDQMPTDVLTFKMPVDTDGNGLAVDKYNAIELGPEIEIRRDRYDQNKDGLTMTQLIMISGESIRVLANDLAPDEGPKPDLTQKIPPESAAGFWVIEEEGGVRIVVRTQGTSRRGHVLRQQTEQLVTPRN